MGPRHCELGKVPHRRAANPASAVPAVLHSYLATAPGQGLYPPPSAPPLTSEGEVVARCIMHAPM